MALTIEAGTLPSQDADFVSGKELGIWDTRMGSVPVTYPQ